MRDEVVRVKRDQTTRHIGWEENDAHPIYLSESMSLTNKSLYYLLQQKKKEVKLTYVWFSGGRVKCRQDDGRPVVVINMLEDLDMFGWPWAVWRPEGIYGSGPSRNIGAEAMDSSCENHKMYISLCPKNSLNKKCPRNSIICLEDTNGQVFDIGSTVKNISYEGSYILNIESKNGNGIFFIKCEPNIHLEPVVENCNNEKTDYYSYTIKWMSSNACPRKQYTAINNCIIYTKEFSFNLRPLQYFHDIIVREGPVEFIIGICRNVSDVRCPASAVCAIANQSSIEPTAIAHTSKSVLQYIDSIGLKLSYYNRGIKKTVISFICSENATEPIVSYEKNNDDVYFFSLSTSVVCPTPKMDCWVHDLKTNISFDLSYLHKVDGNWQLKLANGRKIIFNVCGSLNYVRHITCTGENYFACLIDGKNRTLAYTKYSKLNVESGLLSILYSGVTTDHMGFFLKIFMECSVNDTNPIVQIEKNSTINLLWKSHSACPSFINKGINCKAKNLYTESTVDITALHKNNLDYLVKNHNETFRINICGNLNHPCSKNEDSFVCYKKADGTEVSIANSGGTDLIFKDGLFRLQLEGEPCNKNTLKSKVIIILLCNYFEDDSLNSAGPQLKNASDNCEFIFEWRTNFICKDLIYSDCSLHENNKAFDLSSLRNTKKNYFVPLNATAGIVLNVCLSVIQGHQIRCPAQSGACLINRSLNYTLANDYMTKKKFKNLGTISESGDLKYLNDTLYIIYSNGGICNSDHYGSHITSIEFICNQSAVNTEPIFKEYEHCKHKLVWVTNASCPKIVINPETTELTTTTTTQFVTDNEINIPLIPVPKCVVIDHSSKKRFDLSPLMGHSWLVENSNITIAICAPLANSLCSKTSGACQNSHGSSYTNIGDYNWDLKYEDGSLYLLYKAPRRLTKIEFTCNYITMQPKFIVEREIHEGFMTFISWPTQLACIKEVESSCCEKIKPLCDYYNGTYEISIDSKQSAFLSLCRPLSPKTGLLCTNSTPACIGVHTPDSSFSNEKILGKTIQQSIITENNRIILEYFGGDLCEIDSKKNYSTYIRLFCNNSASEPSPRFVDIKNNCQYVFDWGSSLLCNVTNIKKNKCNIFTNGNIYPSEALRIQKLVGAKGDYIIDLCDLSKKCDGYICKSVKNKTWENFGIERNSSVLLNSRIISYSDPQNTKNGKCGALVEIACNVTLDTIKDPVILKAAAKIRKPVAISTRQLLVWLSDNASIEHNQRITRLTDPHLFGYRCEHLQDW